MRIAVNITRDFVAGITASNINLLKHLLSNDHEFVGLELNGSIYMKGPILFRAFSPEVFDHHILNIQHLPISQAMKKAKSLRSVQQQYSEIIDILRTILKETKPDVVLLSGTYFIPWLISIAAKKENIPTVLWYAGVLSRETTKSSIKNKKIYRAMEKSMILSAKKIIFPSEICREVVQNEVAKKKLRNSFVIPNPVSPVFTDHCATEQTLDRRIAAVGRYSAIKNFNEYFQIHQELIDQKWQHTASFVTASSACTMKKLPKTMNLIPPMTPDGLKRFYLTQGLIISPSIFETFGNVPMEAVCLGIPVLVNKTMGCAEILKQVGLGNMVIDFSDRKEVLERIKSLCGQQILPKQLNALHKILDYRLIGDEIEAIIANSI